MSTVHGPRPPLPIFAEPLRPSAMASSARLDPANVDAATRTKPLPRPPRRHAERSCLHRSRKPAQEGLAGAITERSSQIRKSGLSPDGRNRGTQLTDPADRLRLTRASTRSISLESDRSKRT